MKKELSAAQIAAQAAAQENKAKLSKITIQLTTAKEMGLLGNEFDGADGANELLTIYYGLQGLKLNTFKGWLEKGKAVNKGEKGFQFWTKPKKGTAKREKENGEVAESKYKFFAVCYLFSENQVGMKNNLN
jgi:hypothetical protein